MAACQLAPLSSSLNLRGRRLYSWTPSPLQARPSPDWASEETGRDARGSRDSVAWQPRASLPSRRASQNKSLSFLPGAREQPDDPSSWRS